MTVNRIEVLIPLSGGFTHSLGYELPPKTNGAWLRLRMARVLEAEVEMLEAVWRTPGMCGQCANLLSRAIGQRIDWVRELRDARRRMVPALVPKSAEAKL